MQFLTSLDFWLWAIAGLLAALYVMIGVMKTTRPIPALAGMMKWPGDYPRLVRFVGASELAGALGLVLPLATGILAFLTPVAAICLALVQVLAIGFHAVRGETKQTLGMNLVLLALAAFVAWGRLPVLGV